MTRKIITGATPRLGRIQTFYSANLPGGQLFVIGHLLKLKQITIIITT